MLKPRVADLSACLLVCLSACPLSGDDSTPANAPGGGASGSSGSALGTFGGRGAELGREEVKKYLEDAEKSRFPPPPTEQTLCMLRFEGAADQLGGGVLPTTLSGAVKILGKTDGISMSAELAGLRYQYAEGVSLYLGFKWRNRVITITDGVPVWMGEGDYYLTEGDLQARPYPMCWPHRDPDSD